MKTYIFNGYTRKGGKKMKDVQIIVENELAERFGVEISNVSPTIEGAIVKIYGRIHLTEKFNINKQVLVIKAELLADDFIVDLMTDSMSTLISEYDDFCLYDHMISLDDEYEKILSINKIRIFPAIYQSDDERW